MKFLKILGIIGLLLFCSCSDDDEYAKTMLWKIEGNGLEQASYLFGTLHLTCDATLKKKVERAIEASEILMLELHPDEIWPPEEDYEYVEVEPSLPDGKTLHDYLTDEQYRTIRTYLIQLGDVDIDDYQTTHPIYLSLYRVPPELNCPLLDSFERALTDYAFDSNLEYGGLETLQFQAELLAERPVELHIKYLLKEARSGKPASNDWMRLIQIHYKNENLNGIKRIALSDKYTKTWRDNPRILDARNLNWIPKIDSLVQKKPAFFGVGAAHLVGDNGLIRLLEAKGYTLTPVF